MHSRAHVVRRGSEFDELRRLLDPDDQILDLLMHRIFDVAMCYAYVAVDNPPREAVNLTFDAVGALCERGIALPGFELVRGFSFDEYDSWGAHVSPRGCLGSSRATATLMPSGSAHCRAPPL